jgi:hypothetical protein
MKKYPSCAILLAFLKRKKKVGDFYHYIIGGPFSVQEKNYIKLIEVSNNINKRYLNDNSFLVSDRIKFLFRDMLGRMCSGNVRTKSGADVLYQLYLDWCSFVEEHWTSIYKDYKQLMEKEYGNKKTIQRTRNW